MAEGRNAPCAPWIDETDLCAPCDGLYESNSVLLNEAILAASEFLWAASGRRFNGICAQTIRPCRRRNGSNPQPDREAGAVNVHWYGGSCACNRVSECGCPTLSEIILPGGPVVTISDVTVGTDTLDASTYRLDNSQLLVRLDDADGTNPGWPCCQDLTKAAGEADTFEVSYTHGREPPQLGKMAAGELACELALACDDTLGTCRLSARVQAVTRQGVSMVLVNSTDILTDIESALPAVGLFLRAYNPGRLARRPTVYSPDLGWPGRRVGE